MQPWWYSDRSCRDRRYTWFRIRFLGLIWLSLAVHVSHAADAMITGHEKQSYFVAGQDIQRWVDPQLVVLPSFSSMDNIKALGKASGVSYAIVHSDVYPAFAELTRHDPDADVRRWAQALISQLRVIVPLYDEDIYFIVNRHAHARTLADIGQSRFFLGATGSDTWLTARRIYQAFFQQPPRTADADSAFDEPSVGGEPNVSSLALAQLARGDSSRFDVVVVIGLRSAEFLQHLDPELRILGLPKHDGRLLPLLNQYHLGFLSARVIPNIQGDTPILTVPSYLVTEQFRNPVRNERVRDFAELLCEHVDRLLATRHAAWLTMAWSPSFPQLPSLVRGWQYSELTSPIINHCMQQRAQSPTAMRAFSQD